MPTDSTSDALALKTDVDLVAQPQSAGDVIYGEGETRCELFLPPESSGGLLPVVIALHGGCWRARYDMGHLTPFARALANEGIAVWCQEYRRVGNGGEWPTAFEDVGKGADRLREVAARHNLDLSRVIAAGHSAGGHFALWLAGRVNLPLGNPLRGPDPLRLKAVVALAPAVDLADSVAIGICSGNEVNLMGGTPAEVPEHYAQGSPIEMLPMRIRQSLVCGFHDDTVSVAHVERYLTRARQLGDDIRMRVIANAGHYELVMPGTSAWPIVLDEIRAMAV